MEEFVQKQILMYIKTFMLRNDRQLRALIESAKLGNFQNDGQYMSDISMNGYGDNGIRNVRPNQYYRGSNVPNGWSTSFSFPEGESLGYQNWNMEGGNGGPTNVRYMSQFPQQQLSMGQQSFKNGKYPTSVFELSSKPSASSWNQGTDSVLSEPEMASLRSLRPNSVTYTSSLPNNQANLDLSRSQTAPYTYSRYPQGTRTDTFLNSDSVPGGFMDGRQYNGGSRFTNVPIPKNTAQQSVTLPSTSTIMGHENGPLKQSSPLGNLSQFKTIANSGDSPQNLNSNAKGASVVTTPGASSFSMQSSGDVRGSQDMANSARRNARKYKVFLLDELEDDNDIPGRAMDLSQQINVGDNSQKLSSLANSQLVNSIPKSGSISSALNLPMQQNLMQGSTSSSADASKFQIPVVTSTMSPSKMITSGVSNTAQPSSTGNAGVGTLQKSVMSSQGTGSSESVKIDSNGKNFSESVPRDLQSSSLSSYPVNAINGATAKVVKMFPLGGF